MKSLLIRSSGEYVLGRDPAAEDNGSEAGGNKSKKIIRIAILVGCILIGGGVIFYFLNDARQPVDEGIAPPPIEDNLKSTKTAIHVPIEPLCSSSEILQDGNCVSACGNECIAADCLVSGNGLPLCRHVVESGTNPPKTFTDKDCDVEGYELKDGICSPTCPLECQGGARCKFDFLGNHVCACKKGYKMIDDECQLFCGKNCAENEKCAYDFMGSEICRPIPTTATPTTTTKTCPSKYRLVEGECELFLRTDLC